MSCIPACGPSCTVPSCASTPVIALGPCGPCGYGYGYGGRGIGGAVSSSSLGVLPGAPVSCVSQIPPSEVVIQPPSYVLTIPGPIMSATCDPVAVGGYTACASGPTGCGIGGYGLGGYGSCGYLGSSYKGACRPRRRYSVCGYPC